MRKQRTHGTTYTLTREGGSNVGGVVVVYYQPQCHHDGTW